MTDIIQGIVTEVTDGDTFEIRITRIGRDNRKRYSDTERIRIEKIDAPELPSPSGRRAREELERAIGGKYVRCYVRARDTYGRLICRVELVRVDYKSFM